MIDGNVSARKGPYTYLARATDTESDNAITDVRTIDFHSRSEAEKSHEWESVERSDVIQMEAIRECTAPKGCSATENEDVRTLPRIPGGAKEKGASSGSSRADAFLEQPSYLCKFFSRLLQPFNLPLPFSPRRKEHFIIIHNNELPRSSSPFTGE